MLVFEPIAIQGNGARPDWPGLGHVLTPGPVKVRLTSLMGQEGEVGIPSLRQSSAESAVKHHHRALM